MGNLVVADSFSEEWDGGCFELGHLIICVHGSLGRSVLGGFFLSVQQAASLTCAFMGTKGRVFFGGIVVLFLFVRCFMRSLAHAIAIEIEPRLLAIPAY